MKGIQTLNLDKAPRNDFVIKLWKITDEIVKKEKNPKVHARFSEFVGFVIESVCNPSNDKIIPTILEDAKKEMSKHSDYLILTREDSMLLDAAIDKFKNNNEAIKCIANEMQNLSVYRLRQATPFVDQAVSDDEYVGGVFAFEW